jgi:hypothetical protein
MISQPDVRPFGGLAPFVVSEACRDSTLQLPDIQVGTPNSGSTHLIKTM